MITHTQQLYLRGYTPALIATLQPSSALTHLCLIDCHLTVVPASLLSTSLEQLWLARNQLQTLPENLSQATRLTYLNLDHNRLVSLPSLHRLPLKWLRLNHNQLQTLPPLPPSIERLYLAHNQLTQAPPKTNQLKEVELSYNPITSLSDDFGAGLVRLDVAYTRLTTLPKDLSSWRTLRFLNLAGCPMSTEEKERIRHALQDVTTLIF
jgi:Leucine-rich repeat (LRR) protein